jgi:hypothetical protein
MPFEVQLDEFSAIGYTAHTVREGEEAAIVVREFLSSEDGNFFIGRLEGFVSPILSKLPKVPQAYPSVIDHFLAIVRLDRMATVYINELDIGIEVRLKRSVKKGEAMYEKDIADILKVNLGGIEIPDDAGIIFVFSRGWRKGFFFDFRPLAEEGSLRNYNIESLLGSYHSYLSNQRLFNARESEWEAILSQGWFPFIRLSESTVNSMLEISKTADFNKNFLDQIVMETKASLSTMLDNWRKHAAFLEHLPLIERACERYLSDDYISATSILYPRIEGVMRTLIPPNANIRATSPVLVESVMNARGEKYQPYSLLLPLRFYQFLNEVFFKKFIPGEKIDVSRHSIAHGVASAEDFSAKSATLGLLILDQIHYFLPDVKNLERESLT